jgi:hypothetical protein
MSEFVFLYRGQVRSDSAEQRQKTVQKWAAWITDLNQRGLIVSPGQPLEDTGRIVESPSKVVHDGPFAEIKDLVNGFTIITAADIDEAAEIAKGCPVFADQGRVEVRQVRGAAV